MISCRSRKAPVRPVSGEDFWQPHADLTRIMPSAGWHRSFLKGAVPAASAKRHALSRPSTGSATWMTHRSCTWRFSLPNAQNAVCVITYVPVTVSLLLHCTEPKCPNAPSFTRSGAGSAENAANRSWRLRLPVMSARNAWHPKTGPCLLSGPDLLYGISGGCRGLHPPLF